MVFLIKLRCNFLKFKKTLSIFIEVKEVIVVSFKKTISNNIKNLFIISNILIHKSLVKYGLKKTEYMFLSFDLKLCNFKEKKKKNEILSIIYASIMIKF